MSEGSHRRRNLLTGEWVLVSPHRTQRPWQGEAATPERARPLAHDPACYLCPGNRRANGETNPDYAATFVFPNDFPALHAEAASIAAADAPFEAAPASGEARVICYSPNHGATLADVGAAGLRAVIDSWCALSAELGADHAHVQLFENKGALMGASSPHPHGQAWATDHVPHAVATEDRSQRAWLVERGGVLLDEVAAAELAAAGRIVCVREHWLAFVPHWAAWPFETLVVARSHAARLEDLGEAERADLGAILAELLRRYDALFDCPFPYSMGWHGAPHALGADTAHWRLHAHVYPPLLRSATVRKHMVGYELLAEPQRDLTPEAAATRLREAVP
jgi:UDPglucose--hexose-1-phosphate uridylyltransferase